VFPVVLNADHSFMRVLIVFAHPEPHSFNGALKDLAVETLVTGGHVVRVSDLYAAGFAATAGPADFLCNRADPDYLSIAHEQAHAHRNHAFALDIAAEQEKVLWADLIIFQFPMWWFGMPAILKGWVDRIFARGFAYAAGRKYDSGLLRGRLAMVSTTTGTSEETYAPDGIDGDISHILWPIHNGILRYTGFDVIEPHIAYMPAKVCPEARAIQLNVFRHRLLNIERAEKLFFHPLSDYGPDERLKPDVAARSGFQRKP
jgi:NAD(P)H dehydrogenase (quinone)